MNFLKMGEKQKNQLFKLNKFYFQTMQMLKQMQMHLDLTMENLKSKQPNLNVIFCDSSCLQCRPCV